MSFPILYCGDTELSGAASYLAGLMTANGWSFDYVPSDRPLSEETLGTGRKLFIVSDYPAAQMPTSVQAALAEQVTAGAGLLMIGGWESFHGLGGDWDGSPVGGALPVRIGDVDDRVNFPQSAFLSAAAPDHPTIAGLPWSSTPPAIGGMNRVTIAPRGNGRPDRPTAADLRRRPASLAGQFWAGTAGPGRRRTRQRPDCRVSQRRRSPLGGRFRGLGRSAGDGAGGRGTGRRSRRLVRGFLAATLELDRPSRIIQRVLCHGHVFECSRRANSE